MYSYASEHGVYLEEDLDHMLMNQLFGKIMIGMLQLLTKQKIIISSQIISELKKEQSLT